MAKRGRPLKRHSSKRLRDKRKAIFVAQVIKETGKINLIEAHRRYSPDSKEASHRANYGRMLNDEVMDELEKILRVRDKDLLKKLTPEVIVQDLLDDLRTLSQLVEENKTDWEAVVKLLNAKGVKQKLIGMAIGIWKAEKPQEREKAAEDLLKELEKFGGRN